MLSLNIVAFIAFSGSAFHTVGAAFHTVGAAFHTVGAAFHTVGAAYVNYLLPEVFVFVVGTFYTDLLEDLSCLELLCGTRRSTRYCGANPFKHL